jgi:acetyl-CoA C-acetyltransferase
MPEAVIVAVARSPIGRAGKGSLTSIRADDLAAQVITAALSTVPELDTRDVDDLYLGAAEHSGEQGENMARRVAVTLCFDDMPAVTVNRACASSVQTARMACDAIRSGSGDVFISAGVECVSRFASTSAGGPDGMQFQNPRYAEARGRNAQYLDTGRRWQDPRATGELPDVYIAMGQTAENVADLCGITRREQDEFAARSQALAVAAIESGFYARDITPVTLPDGRVVDTDDGPRPGTTVEGLAALKPVFRADGTVTAGNCCPLNDGAAAVVIMSDTKARALGVAPLARIVSVGVSGLSPEVMGLGPVEATRRALRTAGMTMADIDLVEINEAFAAQVIPSYRQLGIDESVLNVHGGAIALGHPFGSTGARIMTTLIHGLAARDVELGLETMCVGGGQGMAIIVQRLS